MEVNGVAVMRRIADSWLNTTHILKVAGVDKSVRTKILKETQTGIHQKVQGGYGKYQGIWVNYNRGIEFCRQYGVEKLLQPLLEYDIGMACRTPTKEQAIALKNMSSTVANAVNALGRTRIDSPGRGMDGQYEPFLGGSMLSGLLNDSALSQGASFTDFPNIESQEPPRKKARPSQSLTAYEIYGLQPLAPLRGALEGQKKEILLDLFIDPSRTDFDGHPAFLRLSGEEFEIPIDGSCNTALHWAATLARPALVQKLLEKGFNMRRTNSGGETALIAACQARNNLDCSTFLALLELLGPSIEIRDGRGRNLLHHIAKSSAMKNRAGVGEYYLECLLEYVIRQGNTPSSQEISFLSANGVSQRKPCSMTLARFMAEIVNAQDKAGDTALNLAARTGTKSIIDLLLGVGANPCIGNLGGLAPVDFGVGNDMNGPSQHLAALDMPPAVTAASSQTSFADAQTGILTCKSSFPVRCVHTDDV
jgi:regulatory protein SWI6